MQNKYNLQHNIQTLVIKANMLFFHILHAVIHTNRFIYKFFSQSIFLCINFSSQSSSLLLFTSNNINYNNYKQTHVALNII